MLDQNLIVATNQRPTNLFAGGAGFTGVLFPDALNPKFVDLKVAMDWARAGSVYAAFRIATAFTAGAGTNKLRFAIFLSTAGTDLTAVDGGGSAVAADVASGVLAGVNPIVQGAELAQPGLNTVGQYYHLALPALGDLARLASEGYRSVCLGYMTQNTSVDWTGGGVDALWTPHPIPTMPPTFAAGY